MSADGKSTKELLDELKLTLERMRRDAAARITRFKVNKGTHRIRFEAETEDSVDVVIEPREEGGGKR